MVESKLNRRKGSTSSGGSKSNLTRNILCVLLVIILMVITAMITTIVAMKEATKRYDKNEQKQLQEVLARADRDDEEVKVEAVENNVIEIEGDVNGDGNNEVGGIGLLILFLEGVGSMDIELRPDLSPSSVEYIKRMSSAKLCVECHFYLAGEPDKGNVQAIMSEGENAELEEEVEPVMVKKGDCPEGLEKEPTGCDQNSPDDCGCHGPIMEYGMVAWALGGTGPDFFINNNHREPASWLGTQHTVWGQVVGSSSLKVLNKISNLPKKDGLPMDLLDKIPFTMQLIE